MFLGIDQSLTETAIVTLTTPDNYNTSTFHGKGKSSLAKVKDLYPKIFKEISYIHSKTPIEFACIEGGAFSGSGRVFTLGQLSGAIISIFVALDIPFIEVPPPTLKKFMTGFGAIDKEGMIEKIGSKYNAIFKNDNKADAYALAIFALRFSTNTSNFREELESITRMKEGKARKIRLPKTRKKLSF